MKLPTAAILISVLISCHTVDTETENAIKGTFETYSVEDVKLVRK